MEGTTREHADVRVADDSVAPEREVSEGEEAVQRAGAPAKVGATQVKQMAPEEQLDALTWLLTDESEEEQQRPTRLLNLNVGTDQDTKWIEWTITTLDADTFNQIRAQTRSEGGNRQQQRARRRGRGDEMDIDVTTYNLRVVAAATIVPDLDKAVEAKYGGPSADPLYYRVELLRQQFRNKPIILDQIAGEVMLFSGGDEDDVVRATEVTMVRAAGNSRG